MSEHASPPRPAFDQELLPVLNTILAGPVPATVTAELIPDIRKLSFGPTIEQTLTNRPIKRTEFSIPSFDGANIAVSVFQRTNRVPDGPAIVFLHGGGMVAGSRFSGAEMFTDWVERYDAVVATVEYRLAPEHPDPVPIEDCYSALSWFAAQSNVLKFDPERVIVAGQSAGGGLAAGVTLAARDRNAPAILGQVLMCPMLDDYNNSGSSRQYSTGTLWDQASNDTGWTALLGDRRGSEGVSHYASPSRAIDLSNLPSTFLDVGSAEVFRDEVVDYAARIWAAGGDAELHVWPGGFHGFREVAPGAALSRAAEVAQRLWLDRILRFDV